MPRHERQKTKLYAGFPATTWGILAFALMLTFFVFSAWSSAGKVAGNYKFIKHESRSTPTDTEKLYIQHNLRSGKSPGGKMVL